MSHLHAHLPDTLVWRCPDCRRIETYPNCHSYFFLNGPYCMYCHRPLKMVRTFGERL